MRADADGSAEALVIAPDQARARWWAFLASLLVAMTLLLALPSEGGVLEWIAVAVAVSVATYFAIPVVAPRMTTLILDGSGVHGRMYHVEVEVPWHVVQVARVVRVAGEPVLELHVREPSSEGDPWRTRAVGILLPIGADLDALQEALESRIARRWA